MGKSVKSPEYLRSLIKPVFEERFREMLGDDEYERFVESIVQPQRKSFRINTHKVENTDNLVSNLKKKGLSLSPIPWSNNAYFVNFKEDSRIDLGNLFEHFLGEIYIQEATSMTPPEVLEIPYLVRSEYGSDKDESKDKVSGPLQTLSKSFSVLDMCSAPGSKTTQLASLMNDKGTLIANELDYKRIGPLSINLQRTGFSNIIITNNDASNIKGEEVFDRVLLDAPCSGSGVIRKSPGTLKAYNPKKLKGITAQQLKLLKRAYALLKKGGIMTYSTCSLDPEENEFVIKKFLEETPYAILSPISLEGLVLHTPLKSFQGKEIPEIVQNNTLRIWPQSNNTNGFFLAKIQKPLK